MTSCFFSIILISRAEFAAICARFDERAASGEESFTDIETHWAKQDIIKASENGWILGYPDKTFRPNAFITRGEAMAMVNRVLNRNPESKEDLWKEMKEWPDNQEIGKWYYLDVQEATNSHTYERKNNAREYWTTIVPSPDWAGMQE